MAQFTLDDIQATLCAMFLKRLVLQIHRNRLMGKRVKCFQVADQLFRCRLHLDTASEMSDEDLIRLAGQNALNARYGRRGIKFRWCADIIQKGTRAALQLLVMRPKGVAREHAICG